MNKFTWALVFGDVLLGDNEDNEGVNIEDCDPVTKPLVVVVVK